MHQIDNDSELYHISAFREITDKGVVAARTAR
jgi:hypothetical protein